MGGPRARAADKLRRPTPRRVRKLYLIDVDMCLLVSHGLCLNVISHVFSLVECVNINNVEILYMDSVSRLKARVAKMATALRADDARPAMTKDERARYILKLQQAQAKLAQLEGSSGQTASSGQHQVPPAPRSVSGTCGAGCHD